MESSKYIGEVDCIACGYCCGYRREAHFGGCFYSKGELVPSGVEVLQTEDGFKIPVDDNDTCIYLQLLDNGFTRCTIQDKKPDMCKLYFCLIERKVEALKEVSRYLKLKCEERDRKQYSTIVDKIKTESGLWRHQH